MTTGLSVATQMNKTTIAYGSIMKLYVKEFRKDPKDETLSINACIVSRANIGMSGTVDLGRDSGAEKVAA